MSKVQKLKFKKNVNIGAESAEDDDGFLYKCFVDTGDLDILEDTSEPQRIIVGRTGTGKTALLKILNNKHKHSVRIEPEQLSLNYLTNSTILSYLEGIGVKLDIFYKLLWRHIFAVELIKIKYNIKSEKDQGGFLNKISELFTDKRKKQAVDYLVEWGKSFWEETEYRIKELTTKLEEDIKSKIGTNGKLLNVAIEGKRAISEEEKGEIKYKAQNVVNDIQIQKLGKVIELLANDLFIESYPRYYITVDKLDENWVEDRIRYRIIMALIDVVKELQKIRSAKIVVALRLDLIDRVFRNSRDAGFQEEKYQAIMLKLRWTKNELMCVLHKRINYMLEWKYCQQSIETKDIFPKKIDKLNFVDYLIRRTLNRPRDIIQFGNFCLSEAVGRTALSERIIKEAERRYSRKRFRSVLDEWSADYPCLGEISAVLNSKKSEFAIKIISENQFDDLLMEAYENKEKTHLNNTGLVHHFEKYMNNIITFNELRAEIFRIFYIVGFIGIRRKNSQKINWAHQEDILIRSSDIGTESRAVVNPMFYSHFEIINR